MLVIIISHSAFKKYLLNTFSVEDTVINVENTSINHTSKNLTFVKFMF